LAKVKDPEVLSDMDAWTRGLVRFYNAILDRHLDETVQHYHDHVGNRQAWKSQASFLWPERVCPL
jgi:hypothetical protein